MADQHWFDEMSRALATGGTRRDALRRIGAAVAGVVLGSALPAPRPADAQTPPLDNANCGEAGNRCPPGSRCVPGFQAGFSFSTGVCVCRRGGGPRGIPCRADLARGGRITQGGTCCDAPNQCVERGGRQTCGCPDGTTPCPSAAAARVCCPRNTRCVDGQCRCSDGNAFCNGRCCGSSLATCVRDKCTCPSTVGGQPIEECGGACIRKCPEGQFRDRFCACRRCDPPREWCPGLKLCLGPCGGGKIRNPRTCACDFAACPSGSRKCGWTADGRPFCCPNSKTCRPSSTPPRLACCGSSRTSSLEASSHCSYQFVFPPGLS